MYEETVGSFIITDGICEVQRKFVDSISRYRIRIREGVSMCTVQWFTRGYVNRADVQRRVHRIAMQALE